MLRFIFPVLLGLFLVIQPLISRSGGGVIDGEGSIVFSTLFFVLAVIIVRSGVWLWRSMKQPYYVKYGTTTNKKNKGTFRIKCRKVKYSKEDKIPVESATSKRLYSVLHDQSCGQTDRQPDFQTANAPLNSSVTFPGVSATMTWLDIAVAGYLLYGLLNVIFVRNMQVDTLWLLRWTALIAIYFLFRILPEKKWVIYALIVSGAVQSFAAIGQQLWWLESNHINFNVTGTFGNPGQLGGYLAVCFTASFWCAAKAFRQKKTATTIISAAALIIIGAGLVLSDSRAGFLAALCGAGLYFAGKLNAKTRKHKTITITASAIVVAGLITVLFLYRPASARARLLTWRVSADMIAAKPVSGHGAGSFNDHYMLWQAKYFETHPDSDFVMVAANVGYPYNELLHVGIEQGIVGLILAAAVFVMAFSACPRDRRNPVFKAMLAALVVFSMFSYPANVFPLMSLFAVLLGCLTVKSFRRLPVRKWLMAVVMVTAICLLVFAVRSYSRYATLSENIASLQKGDGNAGYDDAHLNCDDPNHSHNNTLGMDCFRKPEHIHDHAVCSDPSHSHTASPVTCNDYSDHDHNHFNVDGHSGAGYSKIRNNAYLRDRYLMWLAQNTDNAQDLELLADVTPACETYIAVGDAFAWLGVYADAERYYRTASYMIPTRMMPNYSLWKLYVETGDTVKAVQAARKIMLQPLKIENIINIRSRAEVRQWLESRK